MARVEGGAVVIVTDWPSLKNLIDTRLLNFRFEDNSISYEIFAIDGQYFYTAPIYKAGVAPENQSLYDTYRAEFEGSYKDRITDFNATDPFFLTSADGYSIILKDGNPPTANDGYGIAVIGIDGSNYRMLRMDSSGRPVFVGAGTAGSPTGGILTVQGTPTGEPLPISGNITASNASVGANDATIPGFSTLIGGSDGTNLRPARIFDADTGGGTQWVLGVGLRKFAGGGSVELGTSSDPIRTDPTGTTTQPVSGTVTANQGGSWTVAGTGNFTVVQSTPSNLRVQLASETNTGTAVPTTAVQMGGSDGTNLRPFFTDSSGRQIVIGAAADGAAATGNPVLIGGSDGTNARTIRTATDGTVRVDPTGTTTQPISGTVTANAGSGTFTVSGTVTANIGTTGGLALDTTLAKLTIAQSTALGSNTQVLVGGSVNTASPSYTDGNINPLSLTTSGALRIDGSAVTQPISGTVTANAGSGTFTVSGTVAATQSGTWTVQQGTPPWSVAGTAANGAAVSGNPVRIGGSDGTNTQDILTDTSGRLTVVGAAADGAAVTGNPILIAGQDGTNTQSIATDGYGRVQVSITGASSTQIEGMATDGTTQVGNPVPIAGVDLDGYVQNLLVDSTGKLQVVLTEATGTPLTLRSTAAIAASTVIYLDYTVPAINDLTISSFYFGGGASGRCTLAKHTSATTTFIANGDFENAGQITPWAAVTGSFTAPTPDSNSTQFQTGAASMRWTYASSATALVRRQTFGTTQDFSGYRYIRVKFFNDAATATTRTISVILTSGTPTRTYSLSGALGSAPFTSNTWITLTCELENPTSSTGTGFDLTAITAIALSMQDANNKTGTVYWDTLRLEDQLDVRHRIYTSTGDTISAPLNPSETFYANESVYLIVKNLAATKNEFTAIAAGSLI